MFERDSDDIIERFQREEQQREAFRMLHSADDRYILDRVLDSEVLDVEYSDEDEEDYNF